MSQENKQDKSKDQPTLPLNRRQRRHMMKDKGMLRYLSKLSFFHPTKVAIRQQNIENGRKIHQAHTDAFEKANAERLEAALEDMKQTWSNIGYNDAEIAMLEEAWATMAVKDKETYQQDKHQARKLMKEAAASRAARNNS